MQTKKYAIYGGSFDPIHVGHIALAEAAVRECGLDRLIFMPAYMSPFKQDSKAADAKDRCGMLESVLNINKAFRMSRYEINKGGPSYTIETLRHWKKILDGELSFVLGLDSVMQLETWFQGREILTDYHLITVRRPHTDYGKGIEAIEKFRQEYGSHITVLDMAPVEASSTQIRNLIKEGRPITGLVTPEVEEYIIEHKLYRQ